MVMNMVLIAIFVLILIITIIMTTSPILLDVADNAMLDKNETQGFLKQGFLKHLETSGLC